MTKKIAWYAGFHRPKVWNQIQKSVSDTGSNGAQVKTFFGVRRTLFARMVAWTLELDSQSLGRTKPYYLG